MKLDADYWTERYEGGTTGWDIGAPSPQLMEIALKFPKDSRILIPGGGNGHEAEALWGLGYANVFLCDFSELPLANFRERVNGFPENQLLHQDFFELHGSYDLVLEQTFFCALDPSLREDYMSQMSRLLVRGGVLSGLLFNFPLTEDGPPFGGSEQEYRERFEPYFRLDVLRESVLSIPPRAGREVYFEAIKK